MVLPTCMSRDTTWIINCEVEYLLDLMHAAVEATSYLARSTLFSARMDLLDHGIELYCIVLYCIVLYCIVLYCIVLYCIVLYCMVLYCIVLLEHVKVGRMHVCWCTHFIKNHTCRSRALLGRLLGTLLRVWIFEDSNSTAALISSACITTEHQGLISNYDSSTWDTKAINQFRVSRLLSRYTLWIVEGTQFVNSCWLNVTVFHFMLFMHPREFERL